MNGIRLDFIADTSAIVHLCRDDAQVEEKVRGKNFAITFVTLAELSLGVLKSTKPDAAWSSLMEILAGHKIISPTRQTPLLYARIYYDLEQRGSMIPINDIWIAAIALQAQLPILARDEHFSRVPGLSVIPC
jgi:predicted nucleic acid-binding protein